MRTKRSTSRHQKRKHRRAARSQKGELLVSVEREPQEALERITKVANTQAKSVRFIDKEKK